MPNQGNDQHTFRMPKKHWRVFEETCRANGIDLPQDQLRILALWWIRTPGVTVKRPPRVGPESG